LTTTSRALSTRKKSLLSFYRYETKIVMAVSLFINMTVIGTFSYFSNKSVFELENAYIALSEVIGPIGGFVWAMGLFSSGQSASIAGALTGQYLTEGR